ncbi:MAG TPA: branched-chain amino acid ABC transporter permease [Bellilinea sp.]|nr:branched-chain amino acid ABC transporter permease [Bellilinea sp.]
MELGFLLGSIVKIVAIIAYFYGVLWVMSLPSRWLKIGGMVVAFGVIQLGLTRFGNFQLLNDFDSGLLFQACAMAMVALGLNLIYGFNGQFSLGQWGFYGIGAYTSADITYRWVNGDARGLIVVGVGTIVGAIILMAIGRLVKKIRGIPVLSAFTLYLIGTLAAGFIAIMAGRLLHPVFQPLLGTNLDPGVLAQGIPMQIMFFLAVIFAGIFAAEISFLFGLPVLTLGSDYFGIATLGFTIVVNVLMINSDTVLPFPEMKGGRGMVGIPKLTTWFWAFLFLMLVIIVMRNILRSSTGRAIMSVREDETAAKAMGIDIAGSKLMAFVIGSLFAGMGGAIYAHFIGFLSPGSFNFLVSFNPLIIVVFGGLGSMTGTIVSSFGWLFFLEGMLRVLLGQMGTEAPTWRYVLYPITLLLMMLIRPQGLLGTVEWGFLKAKVVVNRQKNIPKPADTPAVEV